MAVGVDWVLLAENDQSICLVPALNVVVLARHLGIFELVLLACGCMGSMSELLRVIHPASLSFLCLWKSIETG